MGTSDVLGRLNSPCGFGMFPVGMLSVAPLQKLTRTRRGEFVFLGNASASELSWPGWRCVATMTGSPWCGPPQLHLCRKIGDRPFGFADVEQQVVLCTRLLISSRYGLSSSFYRPVMEVSSANFSSLHVGDCSCGCTAWTGGGPAHSPGGLLCSAPELKRCDCQSKRSGRAQSLPITFTGEIYIEWWAEFNKQHFVVGVIILKVCEDWVEVVLNLQYWI